jgi:hypothetical protein
MFGFRVRFVKEKMTSYTGEGHPSSFADQSHKPIVQYTKERIQGLLSRYDKVDDYFSKQTIVKVLDSDNEEEKAEIERNLILIKSGKRTGANSGNVNPKIRKRC